MDQDAGGILALLELIEDEERRRFLDYDFRTRFRMGVDELPDAMGYDEAAGLVSILRGDPSSALAASAEGWEYPLPRLEAIAADIWDAIAPHTYKKPKRYPRPFPEQPQRQSHGNAAGLDQDEVKARLAAAAGRPGPV